MSATRQSSLDLQKRLLSIPKEIVAALRAPLVKSAEEVADDARTLANAHRRTGKLADSIEATGPNEITPAYAADGGRRTAGDLQSFVTAGSPEARQGHLLEFGTEERHHKDGGSTGKMPETPFLLPAWRLNKPRIERRLKRAVTSAIKKAAQND
ncbi:HK97 gp10 family phage protein [Paenirhodobacter populi]|uniref:HK97 gp10 family phage protein n=1 Tax=Paenirhodobacter populi TaxID=2306993 RepID=A0A443JKV6_9RHOB|nr:HK97 gp10 family phage protein [Sinirhodobacter populi]RWR21133.1 HK97 gp10 family phage protein [Sinirhodobacter populi]